ncbi:imidazolonepropionase [Pseudoalteromonas spongiae]|uniref:imidazolonepropionase n=1 Tax=Pseudoalteromonas spongiae TaxID=298657 RepID=UPI00026C9A53|nr:imidazolonepropionase [Pseudoalteromonas spongiae]ATC99752.1 imidazolonepropionase [Pseudoalteromonas spongiae UST010723-006]
MTANDVNAAAKQSFDLVITNVHIATMDSAIDDTYGTVLNAALGIKNGKIAWCGNAADFPEFDSLQTPVVNGHGKWITPSLIDCHTHIVCAGNRANEFEMRLNGASYQEIAAQGGGIISTVKATREADHESLFVSAKDRLNALLNEGVTTVEIKSGYGLDLDSEIKMLEVAEQLNQHHPIDVQKTFLGAHALPPEYKDKADDYITLVCDEMMPKVAELNLADAVDAFCEGVSFSNEQTRRVFDAAKKHNLPVKLHAEQLSNLQGAQLVAEYNGLSADHIEFLDEAGVVAMAQANTVAVLLPGAFYFLRETQLPPIELLRKHKVAMAIATDFNPGTSPICSVQLMLNMACTLFRLTPAESLAGVTVNAARALGLTDRGVIKVGLNADFVLWDIDSPAQLSYQYGVNPLKGLWKDGQQLK